MSTLTNFCAGDTVTGATARTGGPQSVNINAMFGETAAASDWPVADDFLSGDLTLDYTGTADCSLAVKAVHDAAFAAGHRYLRFRTGTIYAPTLAGACDVIFVGDCVLRGAYRKYIFPEHVVGKYLTASDVTPRYHLPTFLAAVEAATSSAPARVALMGDSTTTQASCYPVTECMENLIREQLARDFPGCFISVFNFGIGSQDWPRANGVADKNLPAWYTNTSAPWLSYIQAFAPHLMIFNLGINNTLRTDYLVDTVAMHAVIAKVQAWSISPDMIFVVNHSHTLSTVASVAAYSNPATREACEQMAGYTRAYAKRYGHGIIDDGRQMVLLRDGIDLLNQSMKQVLSIAGGQVTPWTMPVDEPGYDFDIQARFTGALTTMWTNGKLIFPLSAVPGNVLTIEKDTATGNIAYTVDANTGVNSIARTVSTYSTAGGGDCLLEVCAREARLIIVVNGVVLFQGDVERYGGMFTPTIRWDGGAITTFIIKSASISHPRLFMPQLLDSEVYGMADSGGDIDVSGGDYGGNGINHYCDIGMELIYGTVFRITKFSA